MPSNMSILGATPTAGDWEAHRAQITQLYRDEGRPLYEVMSVVNKSGFRATVKMYKSRIHKWGLDKKHKEQEARAIIHMHARRRGKATQIRLRGQPVDINNVKSYFKRKRIAIEDVLSSEAAALPDLVCETPVISPRAIPQRTSSFPPPLPDADIVSKVQSLAARAGPQRLESPDSLKIAELLFVDIREYVLVSFGTGCWVSLGPDTYCQSKRASFAEDQPLDLYYGIRHACVLFGEKRPAEALQCLSIGFACIKAIVAGQSWAALPYLIKSIAMLLVSQHKPIVLMLCKQLCSMAAIVGSREDWVNFFFRRIFSRISLLAHNDEANDYLLAALRSSIDSHEKALGPFHLQTIHITSKLTSLVSFLYGPEGLVGPLRALCGSLEKQHGPDTVQSLRILFDIVSIQLDCGQFEPAEITAQKAIEKATLPIQSSRSSTEVSLLCDVYLGTCYAQAMRNNFSQAVVNLRKARALIQDERGRDACSALSSSLMVPHEGHRTFEIVEDLRYSYFRRRSSI